MDERLLANIADPMAKTECLVMMAEETDLSAAGRLAAKEEKGAYVYRRLTETAARTQAPLLKELAWQGVPRQSFWVANMVWTRGDAALIQTLAGRADVARVLANPLVPFAGPVGLARFSPRAPAGVEQSLQVIRATNAWALGFTGQGVVVGGADTGYDWTHPALSNQYRGCNGTNVSHDYNWHDAIHTGGGACGANSPSPCDDQLHGTHTMGTMVGDDRAGNQIGVAPGARWIGCRNMDQGNGTPATYAECLQWFIAPTDRNGLNPVPSKAPDVINNSWGCPASEGCTDPNVLKVAVENTRAAGIVIVASAGNSGSGCSTVNEPIPIYAASFSVGAINNNSVIASFSSRGPVTVDGSGRLKPDLSAPGVSIRSSVPGGGYSLMSGTSMAGPHVAGVVALLISAHPQLRGQVDAIENILKQMAAPLTNSETCGGIAATNVPNNTFGWGRVDALAALGLGDTDADQMPDWWEIWRGFNRFDPADAVLDPDIDGLKNRDEYFAGTDPHNPDTDGDGMRDGDEVVAGTSPTNSLSYLGLELPLPQGDSTSGVSWLIRWLSVTGKVYALDRASNLLATPAFFTIDPAITARSDAAQTAFTDAPPAGATHFYRIQVLRP